MKKLYKILTITLIIVGTLLINVPVFANDNATDVPGGTPGVDGEYEDIYTGDGNLITIDYVKKNPALFADFDIKNEFTINRFLNITLNMWSSFNYESEYVNELVSDLNDRWMQSKGASWHKPSNCTCGACKNSAKYVYFVGRYSKDIKVFERYFGKKQTLRLLY